MQVEFSSFIEGDLESIGDYIAHDNPTRAVTFVRELREKIRQIGQNPFLFQLRPEIGQDARIAIIGRYIILFRVFSDRVRIERVVSGYRNLPELPR
jgi:toxin ParE1/3/4